MDEKALEARRKYNRERMRKWRENPANRQKEKQYREKKQEELRLNNINFFNRLAKENENDDSQGN